MRFWNRISTMLSQLFKNICLNSIEANVRENYCKNVYNMKAKTKTKIKTGKLL